MEQYLVAIVPKTKHRQSLKVIVLILYARSKAEALRDAELSHPPMSMREWKRAVVWRLTASNEHLILL